MEQMLCNYVFPEFNSPCGFMRARVSFFRLLCLRLCIFALFLMKLCYNLTCTVEILKVSYISKYWYVFRNLWLLYNESSRLIVEVDTFRTTYRWNMWILESIIIFFHELWISIHNARITETLVTLGEIFYIYEDENMIEFMLHICWIFIWY